MRVAALYDIHGNLPALEAVLDDVRTAGVDSIVIGGDVVPGPLPRETLACLEALEIPVRFLHGDPRPCQRPVAPTAATPIKTGSASSLVRR